MEQTLVIVAVIEAVVAIISLVSLALAISALDRVNEYMARLKRLENRMETRFDIRDRENREKEVVLNYTISDFERRIRELEARKKVWIF